MESVDYPGYKEGAWHPRISPDLAQCYPDRGVIHRWVDYAVQGTHTPVMHHLGAIVPLLAYEAARRGFRFDVGVGPELPRVWAAIIGKSGHGKSYAVTKAREHYERYLLADSPTVPAPWLEMDGTTAGLWEYATGHYEEEIDACVGVIYTDEWARVMSTKDTLAEVLCKWYDGQTHQRKLAKYRQMMREGLQAPDTIRNPAFSATFATTRSGLNQFTTLHHFEGGLFSRLLWFEGLVKSEELMPWAEAYKDEEADALRHWVLWGRHLTGLEAAAPEMVLRVSAEVKEILVRDLFEPQREMLAEGDRTTAAKIRGLVMAQTLSLIYALSRGSTVVSAEDMGAAINLVKLSQEVLGDLAGVLAQKNADATTLQAAIKKALQKAGVGGLVKSKLYQLQKGLQKYELDTALETLLDEEIVIQHKHKTGKKGRPPWVYVHADHLKTRKQQVIRLHPSTGLLPSEQKSGKSDPGKSGHDDCEDH